VAEAREALRPNNEQNLWTVKVLRGGKPVTVEVKIPKKLNKADL
jgi:serine protease Do